MPPPLLAPDVAVSLRFQPPLGKPFRYTVVSRTTRAGDAGAVTQTIPLTLTALSRKAGDTTVRSQTGKVRFDLPADSPLNRARDAMVKAASGKAVTVVVDPYGKPRGAASLTAGVGTQGVAFPTAALRVGDAWTVDLDLSRTLTLDGAKGTGRIPMRYRLTGLNTFGGTVLAKIELKVDGTGSLTTKGGPVALRMQGGGVFQVEPSTGLVVASHTILDLSYGVKGRWSAQRMDVTMQRK